MRRSLLMLCIVIFLGSCVDEITLSGSESQSFTVIQGKLSPDKAEVKISEVSGFGESQTEVPVSEADIFLKDQLGNQWQLFITEPGIYVTDMNLGEDDYGKRYHIEVSYNGKSFQSEPEEFIEAPAPESISAELIRRDELNESNNIVSKAYMRYLISTPITSSNQSESVSLLWEFEETYRFIEAQPPSPLIPQFTCYVTEREGRDLISVFDRSGIQGDEISSYPIFENEIDYRYAVGNYLTVFQNSLTDNAFRYWKEVSLVAEREGSIFEPPPGQVTGNIRNINDPNDQALGYFYVADIEIIRILVSTAEAGAPNSFCSGEGDYFQAPERCRDCLVINNSTYQLPSFWIE